MAHSILPFSAILRALLADAQHGPTQCLRIRSAGARALALKAVKPPFTINNFARIGVHITHQYFPPVDDPMFDEGYSFINADQWHPAPSRMPDWQAIVKVASLVIHGADVELALPWWEDARLDPTHPEFVAYPQKYAVLWLAARSDTRGKQTPLPTSKRPRGTSHADHHVFALVINMLSRGPDDIIDIDRSIELTDKAHGTALDCARPLVQRAVRHLRIQMQMLCEGDARRMEVPCQREVGGIDPAGRSLSHRTDGEFKVDVPEPKPRYTGGAPIRNPATLKWKTRALEAEAHATKMAANIRQFAAELREAGNPDGEAVVLSLIPPQESAQ